jgi:hypothetical protein
MTQKLIVVLGLLWLSVSAHAQWAIQPNSQVGFVSVKNNTIAENNAFGEVTGTIDEQGRVSVSVNLASVQTGIDIRNERLRQMLFEITQFPEATITAQIPTEALEMAHAGGFFDVSLPLTVSLHGATQTLDAALSIDSDGDTLHVRSTKPLLLHTAQFALEGGVAALQAVANLNAISRVVPVTVTLTLSRS